MTPVNLGGPFTSLNLRVPVYRTGKRQQASLLPVKVATRTNPQAPREGLHQPSSGRHVASAGAPARLQLWPGQGGPGPGSAGCR